MAAEIQLLVLMKVNRMFSKLDPDPHWKKNSKINGDPVTALFTIWPFSRAGAR